MGKKTLRGKLIMTSKSILEQLMEEAKNQLCKIEVGQVYEAMTTFYPNEKVPPEEKNVIVEDIKMTLPLAFSCKSKKDFLKDKTKIKKFFKEGTKGDYLLVKKIKGDLIMCKNISINEEFYNQYYKTPGMKKIIITKDDIVKGNVKRVYRGFKNHLEEK